MSARGTALRWLIVGPLMLCGCAAHHQPPTSVTAATPVGDGEYTVYAMTAVISDGMFALGTTGGLEVCESLRRHDLTYALRGLGVALGPCRQATLDVGVNAPDSGYVRAGGHRYIGFQLWPNRALCESARMHDNAQVSGFGPQLICRPAKLTIGGVGESI